MSALSLLSFFIVAQFTAVPPRLTDDAARTRDFPAGDVARARVLNDAGLAARKARKPALELYAAAVVASPSFVPARYNLACEQARAGKTDDAIASLEALHRLGTRETRKYLSLARTDADFEPIRRDPRFAALAAPFVVDWQKPILAQLCADFGRVGSIVDPNVAVHVMTEYEPQGRLRPAKKLKGGPARSAVYAVLEVWCSGEKLSPDGVAGGDETTPRVDKVLAREKAAVCLGGTGYAGCVGDCDGDEEELTDYSSALCFSEFKGGWSLVGVAHIDVSGDAPDEEPLAGLKRSLGIRR